MKGDHNFKKILYSSGFLAFIPAMLISMFLPSFGTKYKLHVEPIDRAFSNYVYDDLNSDGVSEVLNSGKGVPYYNVVFQDNDLHVYDQWNFKDSIDLDLSDFFTGNYDNDLFKEVYVFTYKEDSLFININEFFQTDGLKKDRVYLTKICVVNGKVTSQIFPAGFFDIDGDGNGELFFSIQTGFGLEPRLLYSYDIFRNNLKRSQYTGMICIRPQMSDIDGDGKPEILGMTGASGNYKTPSPFSDMSSWLMVFDNQLKFKFPPVEFPGFTNLLYTFAFNNGSSTELVVSHVTGSADTNVIRPKIMIYSPKGQKIRERLYSDYQLYTNPTVAIFKHKGLDKIFVLGTELLEVNDKLEVVNKTKIPLASEYTCFIVDMDFDGEKELVLFSASEEKILVYNAELEKIIETKLTGSNRMFRFSTYTSKDHINKTFIGDGTHGYFLRINQNEHYYLGYLAYPGVYIICLFFILLIKRINTLQIVQKESLNRRLVTLQLQGIKSQLDPHFTFNTLNSIASLIYLEDRELAYDYMIKFTQLLRSLINDAERIYRSLSEELEFVITYLELEKLRFGDKFNYEISIAENVSRTVQVPKLVLQTFAENAIKHGIMSCPEVGILKINAAMKDDYLILSIEDNGIGRVKARGQSLSTGKGLKLTSEFYDILNHLNKKPISHTIIDLYDEAGESRGTRVEVWVPVELVNVGHRARGIG